MNKKAQLPTLLLVIVAIALSAIALYSFAVSRGGFESRSEEISSIIYAHEFNQQYVLAQTKLLTSQAITSCPNCDTNQLTSNFKNLVRTAHDQYYFEHAGNFYTQVLENKHSFQKNNTITLQIPDIAIQSQNQANKITRTFDICFEFNQQGEFQKTCKLQ